MKKIFMNNCTACHSTSYALQFRFDEAGWSKIIDLMKMVPNNGVYPGPTAKPNMIIDRNQKQLAAYLARARGPGESSMKSAVACRGPQAKLRAPCGRSTTFRSIPIAGIGRPIQPERRHRLDARHARPSSARCRTTAASASTARSTSRSTTRTGWQRSARSTARPAK